MELIISLIVISVLIAHLLVFEWWTQQLEDDENLAENY